MRAYDRLVPFTLKFVTILLCYCFYFPVSIYHVQASEKLFSLKIGPTWPSVTSTSWDAELMSGAFIDRTVGFGIAADFLWNSKIEAHESGNTIITTKDESFYMFPIMGFIVFDPLPAALIHPMLKGEIGYNSLSYNLNAVNPDLKAPANGYYYGLIVKFGIDGLYNFGEQSAAFLGLEYQWAETKKSAGQPNIYYRIDMSGMGLHLGFRFLL
jgi:hypothetical protein